MVSRHETGRVATGNLSQQGQNYRPFVQGDGQSLRGQVDPLVLTHSQQQILNLLEERPIAAAKVASAQSRGYGIDVAFAVMGSVSILAGVVMLFFFAAMGAILLVTGAILCAVAFEHLALSEMAGDEVELTPDLAASARDPRLS